MQPMLIRCVKRRLSEVRCIGFGIQRIVRFKSVLLRGMPKIEQEEAGSIANTVLAEAEESTRWRYLTLTR